MSAALTLAALALALVSAFQLGVWWNIRETRTYQMRWSHRIREGIAGARPPMPPPPNSSGKPPRPRPPLTDPPLSSSLVADGVPGDNPAGVSIPPTNVPPAGVHIENAYKGEALNSRAAQEFFPQYRGRP